MDSELVQQVQAHQAAARDRLIARLVASNTVEFEDVDIATLSIPARIRLAGESERIQYASGRCVATVAMS